MVKVIASYKDAEDTAKAFAKIYEVTSGNVPPDYLEAVKKSLKAAYEGPRMRFYEVLSEACPEALKLFVE